MDKKKIFKFIFLGLFLSFLAIVIYNVADDIIEINRLGKEHNNDALIEYVNSFGWKGAIILSLIEAIQMIIVFIPAEFVQMAAGISYKIWISIPICSFGIFMGASAIYFMVNTLNIKMDSLENKQGKISKFIGDMNKKSNNVSFIMLVLFVTPIIPFGAICYFGATSKIKYRKYILTCLLGTIPSILSSNVLGDAILYAISQGSGSIYLLLVIIVLLMMLLLGIFTYVLQRYMKKDIKFLKPNFFYYHLMYFIMSTIVFFRGAKVKLTNNVKGKKGPFIVLGNHGGFWDFYYMAKAFYPRRITVVMNEYYNYSPVISRLIKPLHSIKKKLFTNDIKTIKNILQASKSGNVIVIMPEGRLSTSGVNFNIADGTEKLIKKLNIDVVDLHIIGSYKTGPKWAVYKRKGRVDVTTKLMISKEELPNLSNEEIKHTIEEHIKYNEFEHEGTYKSKDMTKGLDGILYYCPKCGSIHELVFEKSKGYCKKCGYNVKLNNNYIFESNEDGPKTIHEWYKIQNDFLKNKIFEENLELKTEVTLSIPKGLGKGMMNVGEGVTTLNQKEFKYIGTCKGEEVEIIIPTTSLKGLPYSANLEFELYYKDVLHYFYPKKDVWQCLIWSQFIDILNKVGEDNE